MTILRYWILGLAVLITAVFGYRSAGPWPPSARMPDASSKVTAQAQPPVQPKTPVSPADQPLVQARRQIIEHLDEVPQFAAFYRNLAVSFPHLYGDLVDHSARALAAGGSLPSAGALLWETLRNLQQSSGILAANADENALASFFEARLSMLDVLATADPRTCADFLYGTTDPAIEGFSVAHRDLVAEMAMKQLAVIEDGQQKHLDPGAPTAEDLDLVASGLMAKKLSSDEISLLLDGKAIDPPLPDARTCELGRTYLSVLKDLPHVARQRVYGLAAELLARS